MPLDSFSRPHAALTANCVLAEAWDPISNSLAAGMLIVTGNATYLSKTD
jgi:hypothetical protein